MLTPGHEVRRPSAGGRAPRLPSALEGAADRVASLGGDRADFAARLNATLTEHPDLGERSLAAVTSVAAWRCGVLAVRDDALAQCRSLLDLEGPAPLSSLVGLPAGEVEGFLDAQHHDRFHWPPWSRLGRAFVIARVGGFAGLGGPWTTPPTDPRPIGEGAWLVRSGERWWRLDADLFGHVLAPTDAPADAAASASTGTVELATLPTSYLAHLVHRS